MSTDFRHSHVPSGDGSLHVVEAGDPHGRPYLFLHGWPQSWRTWEDVLALAAPEGRAIAIDLPGVGESASSAGGSKRQRGAKGHPPGSGMGRARLTPVGAKLVGMVASSYRRQ